MSYILYKNIKNIEEFLINKQEDVDGNDITNTVMFQTFVNSFNLIANIVQYNRKLPYFNLKENWALIKCQDFEKALINLQKWLQDVDDRYDGETWTEKVHVSKPTGKLITGEENLQKYVEIIYENIGIIEHGNGVNYINEISVEIDDEDYDRIYVDTPNYVEYRSYAQGLKEAVSAALINGGVTNFKYSKRFGEIKFYQ